MDCYVINLSHHRRDQPYIAVWRPDDKGYAYPLPWGGKYPLDQVAQRPGYYHNGDSNVAVPCEVMDALAVSPEPGVIDSNVGPVVSNSAENWAIILQAIQAMPLKPALEPRPDHPGAPAGTEKYAVLDRYILAAITARRNPHYWQDATRIAQGMADYSGRQPFRIIDGRLQVLRKAGVIRHLSKAESNGQGGWHLVRKAA